MRAFVLLSFILLACSSAPQAHVPRSDVQSGVGVLRSGYQFRGLYSSGFEEESFQPCDGSERWWVANPGALQEPYRTADAAPYEPVYVIILGDTTPRMPGGHLGVYQRYLQVHEVVRMERLDPAELQRYPRTCPSIS